MPKQVRLDDDVVAALDRLVARQGEGSIASHANRKLRQVLGIAPSPSTRLHGVPAPATVSSGAGKARSPLQRRTAGATGPCRHPVGRRIGGSCAECGATLAG